MTCDDKESTVTKFKRLLSAYEKKKGTLTRDV